MAYLFFSFLQFFQWILDQGHLFHYHSSHLYLLFSWLLYFLFFQIFLISFLLFWLMEFLLGKRTHKSNEENSTQRIFTISEDVKFLTCWLCHLMQSSYLLCSYPNQISHHFPSSILFWRDHLSPIFFFSKTNRLIQILVKDGLFWEKSSCYETYFLHRDLLSVQLCSVQVCNTSGHFCARGHGYYAIAFCPWASCICDHLCTKYLCKQEEFRF